MFGKYYRTLFRNESNGYTEFLFQPYEPCEYVTDGLLMCRGKIGIYARTLPLNIDGRFEDGAFIVSNATIALLSSVQNEEFIRSVYPRITDRELERTVLLLGSQLVTDYVSENCDAESQIEAVTGSVHTARNIVQRTRALLKGEETTAFLAGYGIPFDRIEVMLERGMDMDKLREDPYLPICRTPGLTVFHAENIARALKGVLPYDFCRIRGFIYDAFSLSKAAGSTCIRLYDLADLVNRRINISLYPEYRMSVSLIYMVLTEMKDVVIEAESGEMYVYERSIYEEEGNLIQNAVRIMNSSLPLDICPEIEKYERAFGIVYNDEQRSVFKCLETSGIKIVTGPPGAGKTLTLRGIIQAYRDRYPERAISLCATTGRAARVMSWACQMDAQTMHKAADIRPYHGEVVYKTLTDPIDADLMIIDEISMAGLSIMSVMMGALKSGITLILVGDADQLQSVEYGNILHDMIQSGVIEVYRLTKVMRQSGTIDHNARMINKGTDGLICDASFEICPVSCQEEAPALFWQRYKGPERSLVLSLIKKGSMGVNALNSMIQAQIQKGNPVLVYGGTSYYIGDSVMMMRTNYQKGYCNGDIGTITSADGESVVVRFPTQIITLDKEDYFFMTLAYAVTAHKAQGGDAEEVHIFLPMDAPNMLTRRIIYTAVTRARKKVYIYVQSDALSLAVSNVKEHRRTSNLSWKLSKSIKN